MKVGETVWSVKFWAGSGIVPRTVTRVASSEERVVHVWTGISCIREKVGSTVFATRAEAVAQAEKLRAKKLASLARQVAKIQALDFTKG